MIGFGFERKRFRVKGEGGETIGKKGRKDEKRVGAFVAYTEFLVVLINQICSCMRYIVIDTITMSMNTIHWRYIWRFDEKHSIGPHHGLIHFTALCWV